MGFHGVGAAGAPCEGAPPRRGARQAAEEAGAEPPAGALPMISRELRWAEAVGTLRLAVHRVLNYCESTKNPVPFELARLVLEMHAADNAAGELIDEIGRRM